MVHAHGPISGCVKAVSIRKELVMCAVITVKFFKKNCIEVVCVHVCRIQTQTETEAVSSQHVDDHA